MFNSFKLNIKYSSMWYYSVFLSNNFQGNKTLVPRSCTNKTQCAQWGWICYIIVSGHTGPLVVPLIFQPPCLQQPVCLFPLPGHPSPVVTKLTLPAPRCCPWPYHLGEVSLDLPISNCTLSHSFSSYDLVFLGSIISTYYICIHLLMNWLPLLLMH